MVREPDATRQPTPQDHQLMSKHRVLSLKPQLRLERQRQDGQNETKQPDHSARLGDFFTSSTRIRFSVHTGPFHFRCHASRPGYLGECPLRARGGHRRRDASPSKGNRPLRKMMANVQLTDAETGSHLWAERFDKPVADLFDMQDEIVSRLANTLDTQLIEAEARRAESTRHPDAMDLYFQGRACLHKGLTNDCLTQARSFFERALALDPGNIEALVGTARVDFNRVV